MSLNGLFGILDYLIYLVQSTNRHGVHSPFVYHFTDKILYGKTTCAYEPAAEMCRKRMVQSSRKVTLNGQQESLSKIALGLIPSSKYNRLLFRMIQEKQLGQYIIEIGRLGHPAFGRRRVHPDDNHKTVTRSTVALATTAKSKRNHRGHWFICNGHGFC